MDITSFIIGNKYGYKKGYDDGAATGTNPDFCYVTFMNGDEVLYRRAVVNGDDCIDVYEKGLISAPTRATTVGYYYTFSGEWSLTDDDTADEDALKAVTADRTVYACYKATPRKYTISYYDGDTLLKTEAVDYGSMPSAAYIPEKEGFRFSSWEPALAKVTGNASYYAQWTETLTLANATWAEIAEIAEAGETSEYFNIGDKKVISVDGADRTAVIIGFDHDDLADGSGKAKITFFLASSPADTFYISDWSSFSAELESVLLPKFPSELQSLIKPVTKICDSIGSSAIPATTTNIDFKLFPLSMSEMKILAYWGRRYTDSDWYKYFPACGTVYPYYESYYRSDYHGPLLAARAIGSWMRQSSRDTTPSAMYGTQAEIGTTYIRMSSTVASKTNAKTSQIAFCI